MFDDKDTNFSLHVDQAYVEFDFPKIPLTGRVGRMGYKLMLDNNLDGIQFDLKNITNHTLMFSWAKVSESADNLSDIEPYENAGGDPVSSDPRDADLVTINFRREKGETKKADKHADADFTMSCVERHTDITPEVVQKWLIASTVY